MSNTPVELKKAQSKPKLFSPIRTDSFSSLTSSGRTTKKTKRSAKKSKKKEKHGSKLAAFGGVAVESKPLNSQNTDPDSDRSEGSQSHSQTSTSSITSARGKLTSDRELTDKGSNYDDDTMVDEGDDFMETCDDGLGCRDDLIEKVSQLETQKRELQTIVDSYKTQLVRYKTRENDIATKERALVCIEAQYTLEMETERKRLRKAKRDFEMEKARIMVEVESTARETAEALIDSAKKIAEETIAHGNVEVEQMRAEIAAAAREAKEEQERALADIEAQTEKLARRELAYEDRIKAYDRYVDQSEDAMQQPITITVGSQDFQTTPQTIRASRRLYALARAADRGQKIWVGRDASAFEYIHRFLVLGEIADLSVVPEEIRPFVQGDIEYYDIHFEDCEVYGE